MVTKSSGAGKWPHLVIRASAGSGKTFRLSNRYLSLVATGEPADSILATTFTRAAAAEIQDRVLVRMAKAALDDDERRKLSSFLLASDSAGGSAGELTRDECLAHLAELTRNLHRLRIGTLDSFFIQIARSFAWELGLPASWRILDELEDLRLRDEAIAALLASEDRDALTRLVQWLTKGEAQRGLGELLDDTVKKLYDLFREAPHDAWSRIPRPPGLDPDTLSRTMEALAKVPLPSHKSILKAHQQDLEVARQGLWEQFPLRGIAAKVAQGEDTYYNKTLDSHTVEVYGELVRHSSSVLLGKLAAQTEATRDLLERFRDQYERLKRHAGGLLFADVTQLVGDWFARQSAGAAKRGTKGKETASASGEALDQVGFRLDAHLRHLLLDEFQDTSLAQWNVLRPLARRITEAASGTSFFCVGDGKQAIYGWRGGIAEIFDALEDQLSGLQREPLNTSQRSSPVVIDVVNRVFQGMIRHNRLERCEPAVRHWAEAFPEHTTARKGLPGYVTLEAGPVPRGDREEGDDDDSNPLLTHAAERIARLVAEAPGRSVGVLVRGNATIAELIFRLRRLGVPASEEGGNPLSDSAAVQLLLSALEFADHPGHSIARFHLEYSPLAARLGIPPTGSSPTRIAASAREIRAQLVRDGYGPTLESWSAVLAEHCDARDWRRLSQLVARAYEHDQSATLRPSDFVEAVRIERAPDPTAADVRVTTIHKSKGLQYDIVVLPELKASLLGQPDGYVAGRPSKIGPVDTVCRHVRKELRTLLPPKLEALYVEQDRQDTLESLSVLYVALTRAVHALHMIVPAAPNGEKLGLPCNFAGLLRAALTDGHPLAPLEMAFELGDPRWHAHEAPRPVEPPMPLEESIGAVAVELVLAPASGPRRRGLERVAPSELEGGRRVRLSASGTGEGLAARQRGTLLHAWFERVRWMTDGIPADDALRALANQVLDSPATTEQLDEWLALFHAALNNPAIAPVLSSQYYDDLASIGIAVPARAGAGPGTLEVHTERRFAIRAADQLVSGTLDRLVVISRAGQVVAADVVDYKTDVIAKDDSAALRDKVNYYRPQLAAYRDAVARAYSLSPAAIGARLVFVSLGKVVSCPP